MRTGAATTPCSRIGRSGSAATGSKSITVALSPNTQPAPISTRSWAATTQRSPNRAPAPTMTVAEPWTWKRQPSPRTASGAMSSVAPGATSKTGLAGRRRTAGTLLLEQLVGHGGHEQQPAVDDEARARRIGGVGRAEVGDRRRDLASVAGAAGGDAGPVLGVRVAVGLPGHRRGDLARGDAVDGDAVLGELEGHDLRHAAEAVLGRAVGDGALQRDVLVDAGDVDDP